MMTALPPKWSFIKWWPSSSPWRQAGSRTTCWGGGVWGKGGGTCGTLQGFEKISLKPWVACSSTNYIPLPIHLYKINCKQHPFSFSEVHVWDTAVPATLSSLPEIAPCHNLMREELYKWGNTKGRYVKNNVILPDFLNRLFHLWGLEQIYVFEADCCWYLSRIFIV